MKKLAFFMAMVAGVLAISCNKSVVTPEEPQIPDGKYIFTLKAGVADVDVKTTYENDKTFAWSAGDQISVLFHNGTTNKFFTLTNTTGAGTSATFSGAIDADYTIGASDDGAKIALYPADENHVYDPSATHKIMFNIPSEIDYTTSHFSANIPMLATGDNDNNFEFAAISACYKFSFKLEEGISKVRLNAENIGNGYYLSGCSPYRAANGFLAHEKKDGQGSGLKTISLVSNVDENHKVTFYVSFRHAGAFTPKLTLINETTGNTIIALTATEALKSKDGRLDSTGSPAEKSHMFVMPLIDLSAGVSYVSAYGIDWSTVTDSAAGRSDSPYDGIKVLKAKADASILYLYFEVLKASTYPNTEYSHANLLHVYLGDESSTTDYYWQWTSKYTTYFSGWLLQNGVDDFVTYECPGCTSNNELIDDTIYYELAIPRSLYDCLKGTSATVAIEANKQYVEGDWAGESTQIGFAPTTGGETLSVTMPAYVEAP